MATTFSYGAELSALTHVQIVTPWRRFFMVKADEEKAEAMRQTVAAMDALTTGNA
jgi:hypothetical protein